MKHIKRYNSVKEFQDDFGNLRLPCVGQVMTPAGKSIGYSKGETLRFYVHTALISTDNLKTMDFTLLDDIDAEEVQNVIDVWGEGDSMIFNHEVALYLKGDIIVGERAYWEGDTLKYGQGGGGYYYYYPVEDIYPYVKVWFEDGTVIEYERQADVPIFAEAFPNNPVVKVTLGANVDYVDDWFRGCGVLATVIISDDGPELTLATRSFENCFALYRITLPTRVTYIGWHALYLNWAASEVTMKAVIPPNITDSAFSVAGINVPAESLEAYRTATNWNYYAGKIMPFHN